MTIAGADGCKGGWLVLVQDDAGKIVATRVVDLKTILDRHTDLEVLAVDIPIGVPNTGTRACDDESRRFMGSRGSCVFPTPVRATFQANTYPEALLRHREVDGRGLSKQGYAILPKIKQVDELIRSHPNAKAIYEIHPEVSFAAMNGMQPIQRSKHTLEGLSVRLSLITEAFGPDSFRDVRAVFKPSQATDDDILDAFAALWTARRIREKTSGRFPTADHADELGIPMHINF